MEFVTLLVRNYENSVGIKSVMRRKKERDRWVQSIMKSNDKIINSNANAEANKRMADEYRAGGNDVPCKMDTATLKIFLRRDLKMSSRTSLCEEVLRFPRGSSHPTEIFSYPKKDSGFDGVLQQPAQTLFLRHFTTR